MYTIGDHQLVSDCAVVYLDDILVMGKSFEEQLSNLEKVFARLQEAGLRLNPKKCYFLQRKVKYLGHLVSEEGIEADPRKVEAVHNFPPPVTLKALQSFLGLASYYRRFIPAFSKVAHPLYLLTRKNTPFVWTPTSIPTAETPTHLSPTPRLPRL